ncbi:hypothetical protein BCV72DRAFT_309976 [Rhizopus microsporus var. microsporus]|uniref:FAR1 domain-containing protein n=1 Tax=Rhizopus microsporus var. microsporus TaxID=86635 RepID=A0A1X0QP24_RHIZD|nr:hypothetical protein BCV72DRAFT_309976 [Rhizopus microsporus var. microsporus]
MNSNAVDNNIVNLVQDSFKDMNVEFSERFGVDCEYASIAEARSGAADFGKKWNVVLVTVRSNAKKSYLALACKHFGKYKPGKKVATEDEQPNDAAPCDFEEDGLNKKMVTRDTQRNECQCFIKLAASPSGGLRVSGSCGKHNHPISSCRTIYAIHRKQSQEVMDLIMRTLSLPTPNPVDTVMQIVM